MKRIFSYLIVTAIVMALGHNCEYECKCGGDPGDGTIEFRIGASDAANADTTYCICRKCTCEKPKTKGFDEYLKELQEYSQKDTVKEGE